MKIRQDYSYLFSNIYNNNKNNNFMYDFNLSDYASIKNGSYKKVLKAYYKEMDFQKSSSTKQHIVTDPNSSSTVNKSDFSIDNTKKEEIICITYIWQFP